jgi:hypothetical protein
MKTAFTILFLLLAAGRGFAADLVVSNNAIICIFGDSYMIDDQSPMTGYRFPDYVESYFQLNYPGAGIHCYQVSRSGGNMDDVLTNRLQRIALPLWAFGFNNYQHIGIPQATENGNLSSNQMYLSMSNIFRAPALMSDGDAALNTHTGWTTTNTIQWIGFGDIATESSDGDPVNTGARNNAGTNAGWTLGIRGVDTWNRLVGPWTADYAANGGTNVGWFSVASGKSGHPGSGGGLSWTLAFLKGITTDTNVSNCTVDWGGTLVSTNHCVVSSVTRSGNTLTFTRHDDRLPMAWDVPDGTITNDARGAFNLIPADANFFQFTVQITNLPAGTYSVLIDGISVAALSDAALAAGWNMFTNTVGPYWNQRKEVLGRIRDKEYVNRVTLLPGAAGDGQGMVAYGSNAQTQWALNKRGDTMIDSVSNNVVNVLGLDTLTAAAAQPTNHTFSIMLLAPHLAPAHR